MEKSKIMWATLAHLGYNMWGDENHRYVRNTLTHLSTQVMRVDKKYWVEYTNYMASLGLNTLIIDVGEALRYESHPELAVIDSWSREEMEKEIDRLHSIGFTEIIPKLNFGAGHDTWLKIYDHMLSSSVYKQVTADLISEACDVFKAKHLHLGMDEEHYRFQNENRRGLAIVRQGNGWWRDLYHLVDCVEKENARAWVWSDPIWYNPEEFVRKMPRSVVQCNWYYGSEFENPQNTGLDHDDRTYLECFELLDRHGYDQVPTGSNCYGAEENLLDLTKYCHEHVSNEHLLGFMDAPWSAARKSSKERQFRSAGHLAEAKIWYETTVEK